MVIATGYGAAGAATAVAYFEEEKVRIRINRKEVEHRGLNLGHIYLEPTPLGLRVFTKEEGRKDD